MSYYIIFRKAAEVTQIHLKDMSESVDRPSSSWSTYKRACRANNNAEGWHHSISIQTETNSLNMYTLVHVLYQDILLLRVRLISPNKLYGGANRRWYKLTIPSIPKTRKMLHNSNFSHIYSLFCNQIKYPW